MHPEHVCFSERNHPHADVVGTGQHLLQYIPPINSGTSSFSTGSQEQKLRDDKMSARLTPIRNGGERSPRTISTTILSWTIRIQRAGRRQRSRLQRSEFGTAQLVNLGQTKTFGTATVNEIHLSFMRGNNTVGQPVGGVGTKLASQVLLQARELPHRSSRAFDRGYREHCFNSFVMGTPITNLAQVNNTFSRHGQFLPRSGQPYSQNRSELSYEQINVNPNPTFNGSFQFVGSETGSDSRFLIGVASNYNQADSMSFYGRHKYASAFAQDTWRIKPSLTLNYGLRWELMQYWSEKYNQIPTFSLGQQSKVYPTAPVSLVYPGDPGVPNTLVPQRNRFAPRIGLAYSPSAPNGILGKILGSLGKRASAPGMECSIPLFKAIRSPSMNLSLPMG